MSPMSKITSKGQITIPKDVREALALEQGDTIDFRVDGDHAVVKKVPNFLDLAGTVEVPPDVEGLSWEEIEELTYKRRAEAWKRDGR